MRLDTTNGNQVLIDTSVWIECFRDKPTSTNLSKRVDEILSKQDVYVPKIVIAELIQGSKSDREISIIEEFLDAFNIIDQREDTWIRAGKLSFNLRKKGKAINLTDCYISAIGQEYNCQIFSLDEHFKDIQKALNVQLIRSDSD